MQVTREIPSNTVHVPYFYRFFLECTYKTKKEVTPIAVHEYIFRRQWIWNINNEFTFINIY